MVCHSQVDFLSTFWLYFEPLGGYRAFGGGLRVQNFAPASPQWVTSKQGRRVFKSLGTGNTLGINALTRATFAL